MKLLFLCCLSFFLSKLYSQDIVNHQIEPAGEYKTIDLRNDNRVAQLLVDSNYTGLNKLIDSVEKYPNGYTPPVLYFLSNSLFIKKRYVDAEYWFYLAQLRARYDVNRCADKTANASNYNQAFGPQINQYALKNLDTLQQIITKVVAYVKTNTETYDQRWINLSGMKAITESLGGKNKNKNLSVEKTLWPAIKEKTINDYYNDFISFTSIKKNKK